MATFFGYLFGFISHPARTIDRFCADRNRGTMSLLMNAGSSVCLAAAMLPDAIRTDRPHPWALLMIAPLLLMLWLLPALWLMPFCKMLKGKAEVMDTVAGVGPQASIAILVVAVTMAVGEATGDITLAQFDMSREGAPLFIAGACITWVLAISAISVKRIHQISFGRAIAAVALATVTASPLLYFVSGRLA